MRTTTKRGGWRRLVTGPVSPPCAPQRRGRDARAGGQPAATRGGLARAELGSLRLPPCRF